MKRSSTKNRSRAYRRKSSRFRRGQSKRKSIKCKQGYVKSRKTGRCVFATGKVGRSLNKKRNSKKLEHKRSGRASPSVSATLYSPGYVKIGNDGNMWKIKKTSKGIHRWVKN